MRQALKWIYRAVERNVRAVPRKGHDLPPHDIVVEAKPNGGTAQDVINAVERNIAALAVLMPVEHVTVIDNRELDMLLKIANTQLSINPIMPGIPVTFTREKLHENGLHLLDGWAYQRGREIDEQEQHERFKAI